MSRGGWTIGIVITLGLVVVIGAGLFAMGAWGRSYGWGMMGPGMMGAWWGIPFLGPIIGIVLLGLVIGGAVWIVQSLSRDASNQGSGRQVDEPPLEILKRRYASGEVTEEQFEEMRGTLDS
jgi:putative membrane protein